MQSSIQPSTQSFVIRHRSSVIDSVITSFRVAGGGPGWRVAGLLNPAQGKLGQHAVLTLPKGMHYPETRYSILNTLTIQSSIQSSVFNSVICHRLSHLPSRIAFLTPKPEKATK